MLLRPFEIFKDTSSDLLAIIKLNSRFKGHRDVEMFTRIWKRGVIRAAVDGGANVLYNNIAITHTILPPTFISGDFDSINSQILQAYSEHGSEIIPTPDQNYTDFTKCLHILLNKIKLIQLDCIVVHVGDMRGRLDHTFANVNTLYSARGLTNIPIYLVHNDSISFILNKGKHMIESESRFRSDWCSLIPVGRTCNNVTTSGLKYNLSNEILEFGGMVSTSNSFDESQKHVHVDTDEPLLCSFGYLL